MSASHPDIAKDDKSAARSFVRRHGTQLGAGASATAAAVLLVVALGSGGGSDSGTAASNKASVVVATSTIHRGTVLDSHAVADALTVKRVANGDVNASAVTSLTALQGKVATEEILPGAQITTSDVSTDTSALASRLTATERAITLPIDAAHGMVGDVVAGDRVDVYASFDESGSRPAALKLIAANVEVLRAPAAIDGTSDHDAKATAQVTLKLRSGTAQKAAYTADQGKLWVVARPAAGAKSGSAAKVTTGAVLGSGS